MVIIKKEKQQMSEFHMPAIKHHLVHIEKHVAKTELSNDLYIITLRYKSCKN